MKKEMKQKHHYTAIYDTEILQGVEYYFTLESSDVYDVLDFCRWKFSADSLRIVCEDSHVTYKVEHLHDDAITICPIK